MDLALEASTPGQGPLLIGSGRTVLFAQHTRRFGNLCKLRILLGCSLQLPQLAPIMSVTLLCVLVGWAMPETLKGNL